MIKKEDIEIPEPMLKTIKMAQEASARLQENIKDIIPKIPKIDLPTFNIPNLDETEMVIPFINKEAVREENEWERHTEIINTQNISLSVLKKILDEQKSTSRMTKWIIWLTIGIFFLTILAIIATISS